MRIEQAVNLEDVLAQIGCARLGALDGGYPAHNVVAQAAQRTGARS
jgi:hypothetical protein